ncbi:hypothetical protein HDU76_006241 [Blyttiomyces sp. JEL0837]|nr:hypothetical protein HDU76_006241 [Blyttiomyces sp. JEL0837]
MTISINNIVLIATLVVMLAIAPSQAHFQITYPTARTFSEVNEIYGPCGNEPLATRSYFPINGGFLKGKSYHSSAQAQFNIAITSSDPTTAQFNQTFGPGTATIAYGDFQTVPFDLSKIPGVVNNTMATLQVVFNAGDGILYQCSDVILIANATNTNAAIHSTSASSTLAIFFSAVSMIILALTNL